MTTMPLPQQPQQPAPPQPLELPPVSYKPYKPNPRTTRSLMRRSYAIATPPPSPLRLQGSPTPLGPAAPLGTMSSGMLPGFSQNPAPAMAPPPTGGLPGFSRGGVVTFADGGDVNYDPSSWWNTPLGDLATSRT